MKIGEIEVAVINDRMWHMDGGAMFGVVPRAMWEKKLTPDGLNRVGMAARCLLIRVGRQLIVVDTGLGDKFGARETELFGMQPGPGLVGELRAMGISPNDIEIVVDTHLHMDHAGGNTTLRNGEVVPTFSRAQYWVQREEWEDAISPNERTRATYLPDNLLPIEASGQLKLVDGAREIAPGVQWLMAPGHTRAHTMILIESRGQSALFTVDVAPFLAHLERVAWIAAVDLDPLQAMDTKRRVIADVLAHDRVVIFDHDPNVESARLAGSLERWTVEPV